MGDALRTRFKLAHMGQLALSTHVMSQDERDRSFAALREECGEIEEKLRDLEAMEEVAAVKAAQAQANAEKRSSAANRGQDSGGRVLKVSAVQSNSQGPP